MTNAIRTPEALYAAAPAHWDGRFLKYAVSLCQKAGVLRVARQFDAVPEGMLPLEHLPGVRAVYFAPHRVLWIARAALWINRHKWDLDEWCYVHGLMWLEDGGFYRDARWRFPWRNLPSLPALIRSWNQQGNQQASA